MADKDRESAQTFEKALSRLEVLVREMEGGNLGLDKMMGLFEEGTQLVAFCSKQLNEVEKKIEILVKKGSDVSAQAFKPVDDDGENG